MYLNHLRPENAPNGPEYCRTQIGRNTRRWDGPAKVSGTMEYPSDIYVPGMWHAAVLYSPYAHAKIVSVDTSEAEKMGAVCLTHEDIPDTVYNERSVSTPAGTYRDRTILPDRARHVGEPLMAVAAPTEELAFKALHGCRQLLGYLFQKPLSKANVKKLPFGGGFGSSIHVNTVIPICAALAIKTGKPMKLCNTREGDFYSHNKYPTKFHVRLGVSNDGILTAAEVKALVDFGAHQVQPLPYMGCTAGWFASLYKYTGNITFEGTAVYTNKTPCCAMQGYGNPQVNFAIESMVDQICDEMGFDPIEFRLKNIRTIGDEFWAQGPTVSPARTFAYSLIIRYPFAAGSRTVASSNERFSGKWNRQFG